MKLTRAAQRRGNPRPRRGAAEGATRLMLTLPNEGTLAGVCVDRRVSWNADATQCDACWRRARHTRGHEFTTAAKPRGPKPPAPTLRAKLNEADRDSEPRAAAHVRDAQRRADCDVALAAAACMLTNPACQLTLR